MFRKLLQSAGNLEVEDGSLGSGWQMLPVFRVMTMKSSKW